jgi:hypothetical protein
MKNNKYHTFRTFLKFKVERVETETKLISLLMHIHNCSNYWIDTVDLIKKMVGLNDFYCPQPPL